MLLEAATAVAGALEEEEEAEGKLSAAATSPRRKRSSSCGSGGGPVGQNTAVKEQRRVSEHVKGKKQQQGNVRARVSA